MPASSSSRTPSSSTAPAAAAAAPTAAAAAASPASKYPRFGKRGAPQAFPSKLYEILEGENPDIVGWTATGRGFEVRGASVVCVFIIIFVCVCNLCLTEVCGVRCNDMPHGYICRSFAAGHCCCAVPFAAAATASAVFAARWWLSVTYRGVCCLLPLCWLLRVLSSAEFFGISLSRERTAVYVALSLCLSSSLHCSSLLLCRQPTKISAMRLHAPCTLSRVRAVDHNCHTTRASLYSNNALSFLVPDPAQKKSFLLF